MVFGFVHLRIGNHDSSNNNNNNRNQFVLSTGLGHHPREIPLHKLFV